MTHKKVIHICMGKANPERMNGVNRVVHGMATAQARARGKHQLALEVWGLTATPDKETFARPYPLRLFAQARQGRTWKIAPELQDALNTLDPSTTILHMHGAWIPCFTTITALARRRKIPYVIMPYGAYSDLCFARRWWLKKTYLHLFEGRMLRHAAGLYSIGIDERKNISNYWSESFANGRAKPCPILMNAANCDEIPDQNSYIKEPQDDALVFGYVGRLDQYHKGLNLLVDGFAAYRKQGGKAKLWFVGDGEHRQALEDQAAQLEIKDAVTFWGAQFGADKLALLAKMDAFMHPSRWDAAPTAVLEAAGWGRPLIASAPTGFAPYIERHGAGIVLPTPSADEITKAMQKFDGLSLAERQVMSQGARALVEVDLNWDHLWPRIKAELYDRVWPSLEGQNQSELRHAA